MTTLITPRGKEAIHLHLDAMHTCVQLTELNVTRPEYHPPLPISPQRMACCTIHTFTHKRGVVRTSEFGTDPQLAPRSELM
jgi:hypothetical protein